MDCWPALATMGDQTVCLRRAAVGVVDLALSAAIQQAGKVSSLLTVSGCEWG